MEQVSISGNIANMLTYLGSVYRNPADAVKEYVSNALDAWQVAKTSGSLSGPCSVAFRLQRSKIVIDCEVPGMDETEFRVALHQVANSAKRTLSIPQIGRLGIGIFAFNQIGSVATFYSRKSPETSTTKVVLQRDRDVAEIGTASPEEELPRPGMRIVIEGLASDPTKARSPLGGERLMAYFADAFDSHLQSGNLKLELAWGKHRQRVKPKPVSLPKLLAGDSTIIVGVDPARTIRLQLYFDETGKSSVAIRHSGVVIVDDVKTCSGYGLEDSEFAGGFVHGYIDADFLRPLPARTGFADDRSWKEFVSGLGNVHAQLEKEVSRLQDETRRRNLTEIQKKAIRLANDILNREEFKDLELLAGMRQPREAPKPSDGQKKGIRSRVNRISQLFRRRPPEPGTRPGGLRIAYKEEAIRGSMLHSDFTAGIVTANTLNPDYKALVADEERLAYGVLLIGKETIAYEDKTGSSNRLLEKMLSYVFAVDRTIRRSPRPPARRKRATSAKGAKRATSVRATKTPRGQQRPRSTGQAKLPL